MQGENTETDVAAMATWVSIHSPRLTLLRITGPVGGDGSVPANTPPTQTHIDTYTHTRTDACTRNITRGVNSLLPR